MTECIRRSGANNDFRRREEENEREKKNKVVVIVVFVVVVVVRGVLVLVLVLVVERTADGFAAKLNYSRQMREKITKRPRGNGGF